MGHVHFFQRYHGKENRHSSAACLLLSFLYNHNPALLHNLISSIFSIDRADLSISFITQDKNKNSGTIPDFSIMQTGFKLSVEAKEKEDNSSITQLKGHINSLIKENVKFKFLVLLVPRIGAKDVTNINSLEKEYPNVYSKAITYFNLYTLIRDMLVEIKDDDLIDIVEDFRDYCDEEGLFDKSKDTMMVRLAGNTMEWNLKYNIYYDVASHKSTGFSYLGLYKDKSINYIGKIKAVVRCKLQDNKVKILETIYGDIFENDKNILEQSLRHQETIGDNMSCEYCYFLVDEYVPTDFRKESKYALYGRKKFYLPDYVENLENVYDIAEKLKKCKW